MEPNIELHLINYRLKILSIKKNSIHKLMHPLIKIAFTNRTKSTFISFSETNDDYSIVVDLCGFEELEPYLNETDIRLSQSNWIPMYLCGDDLPGAISLSKIAKYLILPLAEWKISIMAISMYQCDYVLIQEKDYEIVIRCLSNHIPKIYDESLTSENEIVFMRSKGKSVFNLSSNRLATSVTYNNGKNKTNDCVISSENGDCNNKQMNQNSCGYNNGKNTNPQMQITLPLLIPDKIEYCITGLYDLNKFFLIIPILIDIMFYETGDYLDNEIFFNFTKKETDISIVMETGLLKKFPPGTLLNVETDYWRLVRIGQAPVGLEVFGVCASISQPLELMNIDEYYISSYHTGYCFIPTDKLEIAKDCFAKVKARFVDTSKAIEQEIINTLCENPNIKHNFKSYSNHDDQLINADNTQDCDEKYTNKQQQEDNDADLKKSSFLLLKETTPNDSIQVIN